MTALRRGLDALSFFIFVVDKVRIILYARVSRNDLNLDNQIIPLKRRADNEQWEYVIFTEKESTRNTRPVKEEILNLLRNKEFDGVCVYALDRWCRSVSEFALELEEFERRKIGFYSLRESFVFDSAMGRAMAQLVMVFAQLERDLIRERTMAGLDRARAWGKKLGRPKGSLDKHPRKTPPKKPIKDYITKFTTQQSPVF